MSYFGVQLIKKFKNWHELMNKGIENITKVISKTQKIGSIGSTPYKANKKPDIKYFLNRHLMVPINTTI